MHECLEGNEQAAQSYLNHAIEGLRKEDWPANMVADWLEGDNNLTEDELCGIVMDPGQKAIVLAALGVKYPEHRECLFELANKLNFERRFPHHFLNLVFSSFLPEG